MVSDESYAQKMRDKSSAVYHTKKDDLEFQARRAYSRKKSRALVSQLRAYLRVLYNEHPDCFSEEEYLLAFGFKAAKNYICNSSKQLQDLINKVEDRLNEKRKN